MLAALPEALPMMFARLLRVVALVLGALLGVTGSLHCGVVLAQATVTPPISPATATPPVVPAAAAVAPAANPLADLVTMAYQPQTGLEGAVRIASSATLQQSAALWIQGFSRLHPQVECSITPANSENGPKLVAEGKVDMALVSKPVDDAERAAWEQQSGRRIAVVAVAFDRLVWVVNAANPVAELPWSPEAGILRPVAQPPGAAPAATTHWADLNGSPEWKDVPIVVHTRRLGSGTRWHLDRLLSGAKPSSLKVVEHATETELSEALASDRGSLGLVGDEHARWQGVKLLPLLIPADASPLKDSVAGSARTPDCRPLFLVVSLPKEGGLPKQLQAFMSYVFSYPGQLDVVKDGLSPLTRGEIHSQRELLGWSTEK
ncbi:MAG: hypothetical protein RLZZ111_2374 [Planctomycetota bacterium]|jgi:ABC-type phosphate transport system substrate-binding protein